MAGTVDYAFTGAGAAEQQRQQQRNDWLSAFSGHVDSWLASRQPYQEDIYNKTFSADRKAVDIAAKDAQRQESYAVAQRGIRGSSIAAGRQGKLGAAYAGQLAQVNDRARSLADAQKLADQQAAQQYKLLAQQYRPGEYFQGVLDTTALDDQTRLAQLLAQAASMAYGR